ncbi:MAG TPA: T9SS type A sorting domain-containing protein, partial [bacterium]|nr:T9SS type A sorting domain-containing protein [bacterium]
YQPSGTEYREILVSGRDGTAGTVLTLGEKTGPNRVRARAFGSDVTAEFTVTGVADMPVSVTVENQNQTGAARELLTRPFRLTLKDQYDNFTPGVIVNFDLIQGDGTLTARRDTTDANGQALTYLQLGYGSAPNQVRATIVGSLLEPVLFTGTAISGLAHTLESQVQKITTKHYINQTYPNILRARVLNDLGQPMQDVPMTFVVTQGSASTGARQPKMTNAQGIAMDTLRLGTQAGEVHVEARAAGLSTKILIDSVYNYASFLQRSGPEIVAADVQTEISRRTVRVRAWNNYPITPAATLSVLFVAKGHGFKFPNGNDSLIVRTNNEGYAETLVVPGPIHGIYNNIIEAQATNGFFPITGSPAPFTIQNFSEASKLLHVQGDSLVGVVQEFLETPLQVMMVKEPGGIPIVNQPVLFKIESGGGRFSETEFPEYTVYTNSDGIAGIFYKVGPKTGTPENPFNNLITARATNGVVPLDGSPVNFRVSAQSSIASAMAADNQDTLFTGTAGKPLTRKVRVKVMDSQGNGVAGEEVVFSVIQGGGTLGGGSDTTKTVLIDNANGIAEVTWTLGPVAGVRNNRLHAAASNGTSTLAGSPITFYATGVADSVSAVQSRITAESPRQSSGEDTCRIEITLVDKFNNPVAGKRVQLSVTGGDRNHIYSPINPTDANGKTQGYLLSYSAGLKRISARVIEDDKLLQNRAEVIFTASDAAQMRKHNAGPLVGNAGTVLRDSIAVYVSDPNGNPVAYGPVTFTVKSGGGQIVGSRTVMSDSNGIASVWFILGAEAGNNVVEASARALDASPLLGSPVTFDVTGKPGVPISMLPASGQVFEGPAGEVLSEPFKVAVIDEVGDPVGNVSILFEVQQGGGRLVAAQPVRTNAWGEAVAFFRADEQVGVVNQILASANLAGGPFLFEVTSRPGRADRIVHRSGNGQSGGVNGAIDISVIVTDKYNNPVRGIDVQFEILSGDANFAGNTSIVATSNSEGIAQALVRLGPTAGDVRVHAIGRLLKGSPLPFTLYALSSEPTSLARYPASTADMIATKGHPLPGPLHVRIEDDLGNPVPGRNVVWAMAAGDGELLDSSPVLSDAHGVASMRFRAGQGDESIVKAMMAGMEVLFAVRQVANPNFPKLDMSLTAPRYEIFEGDLLNIPIRSLPDPDGDPLTFELGNLFPPRGVEVKKQSATTAVLQWTPDYDQQGEYTFHIRVVDGRGGFDTDSVRVTVYDTNRDPRIVQTFPVRADTAITSGQVIRFWVGAVDPDGDPLHYTWKVDGVSQGIDSPVFDLDIDRFFWGHMTVLVIVSDGKKAEGARFSWNLDIITSVQLSEFLASFDPWKNTVYVHWQTSRETDNRGFEVLRSTFRDGTYEPVTERLIPSRKDGTYEFADEDVRVGAVYHYKLIDIDVRGNRNENGPISVRIPKPDQFVLTQNYPNPFNPVTMIRYHVPNTEQVSIMIYNIMGQRVATLVDHEHEPGYYTATWDGRNTWGGEASTGLYIYRLQSETKVLTKRMVKLK